MKIAEERLTFTFYLPHLEKQLDDDRECGEWSNSIISSKLDEDV